MAGGLFDDVTESSQYGTTPAPVRVNPSAPPAAVPRLSRQCDAILSRLRAGRATNAVLAGIALKYTGRLSELKQAGHDIRVVEHDHKTGRAVYGLFVNGVEV